MGTCVREAIASPITAVAEREAKAEPEAEAELDL